MARTADSSTVGTTATTIFEVLKTSAIPVSPIEVKIACDSASAAELLVNVVGLHGDDDDTPMVPIAAGTSETFLMREGINKITAKGNGGTATYTMFPLSQ